MRIPVQVYAEPDMTDIEHIIKRPDQHDSEIREQVRGILDQVRLKGDQALKEFTRIFDRVEIDRILLTDKEVAAAASKVAPELKTAMEQARANIYAFHAAQGKSEVSVETQKGVRCWRRVQPIERVGIYVPGGVAPLFSSVFMLAIPAQIAGCSEIVLASPPNKTGDIYPATVYAAQLCGVTKIIRAGGAQAIAAMAYGTTSVPKVDKILGPGNRYTTAAKQMVAGEYTAVDIPAGPSEVMILADSSSVPEVIAADMLSQAEHGNDSQAIAVVPDKKMADQVISELLDQLEKLPRKEFALASLANSMIVCTEDREKILNLVNGYAPEHLIILRQDADQWETCIKHAGSVFMGPWTPESAGDYASGTNHTLPTGGWARAYSGISVESFQKHITFQRIEPAGLRNLGPVVEILASEEGLEGHRNAVTVRLNRLHGEKGGTV